ncbi:hypothetical protein ACTNEO_04990 [Gracilibacillus sp. HCP3S3_G5_1]|uniref:hypothetical protein n=1 Tax=unclassified Gracilibacillus TaxID=2625209 RepID=UPI003F88872C
MQQNTDTILNILNNEWANDLKIAKSKIAILAAENEQLKRENETLRKGREKLEEENAE